MSFEAWRWVGGAAKGGTHGRVSDKQSRCARCMVFRQLGSRVVSDFRAYLVWQLNGLPWCSERMVDRRRAPGW